MSQDLVYAAVARSVQKAIKQEPKKVRRIVKEPSMHAIGQDEPEHLESDEVTLSRQYLENKDVYEELLGEQEETKEKYPAHQSASPYRTVPEDSHKYGKEGKVTKLLDDADDKPNKPPSIDLEV